MTANGADIGDGRRARRRRNEETVLAAARQLFNEDLVAPSMERVAERAGISLRSLYRYFEDGDALLRAAVERDLAEGLELIHIHEIGQGPLEDRVERFLTSRMRTYRRFGASYRAAVQFANAHPDVRHGLEETRRAFRTQIDRHFAPELDGLDPEARRSAAAACDVLTQFESIDLLRRFRRLTVAQTEQTLRRSLMALLRP